MAIVTRVSGDFKPVMNVDTGSYTAGDVNAVTSGATVNVQGPKLDFCTITYTGTATTGAQIKASIDAIQARTTIAMYEWTTVGGGNDTLAVAFYGTEAWGTDLTATGAGTLDQAVTDAAGEAVSVAASATFTN